MTVSPYLTLPLRTESQVRAMRDCPDCEGRGQVHLAGELLPCPACRPDDYAAEARERRIDPGFDGPETLPNVDGRPLL